MSLDYSDKKLHRYFDALFVVGKMGDSKKELANLQKVMKPQDYAELLIFDEKHHEMVEIVSRDENEYVSDAELKKIADYEKIADEINILPQYKAKMYDCVLIGVDRFAPSNVHSLLLLNKTADIIPPKKRNDLERLQRQAVFYKNGAGVLYDRLNDKIELKLKGKNPTDVSFAQAQFNKIAEDLKEPHTKDERIKLLEKQLELVDKCAFKRMKKFQTKAAICYDLSNEYAGIRDIGKHDSYLNDAHYYQKLVKNIVEHTK